MTRYVPIVAVVPEAVALAIDTWAEDPVALEAVAPLAALMERNGWTVQMLLAGIAVTSAIGAQP